MSTLYRECPCGGSIESEGTDASSRDAVKAWLREHRHTNDTVTRNGLELRVGLNGPGAYYPAMTQTGDRA